MTNENYGAEDWRQPKEAEGETVLFSEPGRVLPKASGSMGVDCRSHSYKIVKTPYGGGLYLLVRHGGGDERVKLDYSERLIASLEPLESDARYWLMRSFLDVFHNADQGARQETATKYARAFAEGRLKKKRRNNRVYVEIQEPAIAATAA